VTADQPIAIGSWVAAPVHDGRAHWPEPSTPTPGPVDIACVEDAWTWLRTRPEAPSTEHMHSVVIDRWQSGTVTARIGHHMAWLAWVMWLGLAFEQKPVGGAVLHIAAGRVLADGRHIDVTLTFTALADVGDGAR